MVWWCLLRRVLWFCGLVHERAVGALKVSSGSSPGGVGTNAMQCTADGGVWE